MKHKKIVITGGTGYLGQALARWFGKDNHVVLLSRHAVNGHNNNFNKQLVKASDGYNITYWRWDGKHVEKHWAQDIENADIVINLAGKSVNCRYTWSNRAEIINSRTDATRTIGAAIRNAVVPPTLWINAASATIYRHTLDTPNDEANGVISGRKNDNMPYSFAERLRRSCNRWLTGIRYGKKSEKYLSFDKDFSVEVCQQWESAFFAQRSPFTRKIALRMAIVLGQGGLIVPYLNLVKFRLGGHQGNGKQLFSWVHIEDVCRAIEWCYEHQEAEGIYNCVSPHAVTNHYFMATLRKLTGHKIGLPAPAWLLEAGAVLMRTETELILKSRWVKPARFMTEGFQFKYQTVDDALKEIISNTPRKSYHLF